jgi:hypothetical protein
MSAKSKKNQTKSKQVTELASLNQMNIADKGQSCFQLYDSEGYLDIDKEQTRTLITKHMSLCCSANETCKFDYSLSSGHHDLQLKLESVNPEDLPHQQIFVVDLYLNHSKTPTHMNMTAQELMDVVNYGEKSKFVKTHLPALVSQVSELRQIKKEKPKQITQSNEGKKTKLSDLSHRRKN